jgi:hypothetical protein
MAAMRNIQLANLSDGIVVVVVVVFLFPCQELTKHYIKIHYTGN